MTMPSVDFNTQYHSYQAIGVRHLDELCQRMGASKDLSIAIQAVATVFPFRTNIYVLEELIDWDAVPEDPIYQMVFPQPGMLKADDLQHMIALIRNGASRHEIERAAHSIRLRLNPHPGGQLDLNVPSLQGRPLRGFQHKYQDTLLFFPSNGQTCHAYCNYCFRWPQFIGEPSLKIAMREAVTLSAYLQVHPEVTDVLMTGGDPLIMTVRQLEQYIEPLLDPSLHTVQTIRIGTKVFTYWPQRFVSDKDANELLRLFERVVRAGKQLAIMAHLSHPRELTPSIAQEAIQRVRQTGAIIRCQAPLIRRINDSAETWSALWNSCLRSGIIPYYMFVERDTGPKHYFEVPLAKAHDIFRGAISTCSGLAATVRGPVMSATPGKVIINGIADVANERVFQLQFVRARNPSWVGVPFFAQFDSQATWLTDLRPAFGDQKFFYEES